MVQGHRWRGAEPELHHRAHGPPGLRWTVRGLLMLNWTQGSGSGVPEWKFWYIYQKYVLNFYLNFLILHNLFHVFDNCLCWEIHIVTVFPSYSTHYSQESLQLETAVCYVLQAEHQVGCGSLGYLGEEMIWLTSLIPIKNDELKRFVRKVPWMLSRCWPACMGRLEG